jgi:hypothetical protein
MAYLVRQIIHLPASPENAKGGKAPDA